MKRTITIRHTPGNIKSNLFSVSVKGIRFTMSIYELRNMRNILEKKFGNGYEGIEK